MVQSLVEINENELRLEFIKKMEEIKKQRSIRVNDFIKRYYQGL